MGRIIAFVPVRGGSKSIPLKNVRIFCGKPLVYWSLIALQNVVCIDEIIVATDSDIIEKTVHSFNFSKVCVYRRMPQNATDTASTESVMLEYISYRKMAKEDLFILVQATSPMTQSIHLEEALKKYYSERYDSLLTCVPLKRFLWNVDGTSKNYDYNHRPRRQDFSGELMENGAFYINTVNNILESGNRLCGKIGIYEMPEYMASEIDEPDDWILMENLMRKYVLRSFDISGIKLLISDVDGVLTDGGMYYTEKGDEFKKFNTRDGMAFELLRYSNIKTAIITSENTKSVERRAQKMKIDYLYQGKKGGGKLVCAKEICEIEKISMEEVAYIGDDINCLDLLSNVGLSACPSDAVENVKSIPGIHVLSAKGGCGAVREFVDLIISNK